MVLHGRAIYSLLFILLLFDMSTCLAKSNITNEGITKQVQLLSQPDPVNKKIPDNNQTLMTPLAAGFIGILLIMCFYNVIFFRNTHDIAFLYFSAYLFSVFLVYASQPLGQVFFNYRISLNFIMLSFALMFTLTFLKADKRHHLYWLAGRILTCFLLINALMSALWLNLLPIQYIAICKVVVLVFMSLLLLKCYRTTSGWTGLFLLSWLPVYILYVLEFVDLQKINLYGGQLEFIVVTGILLQILIASISFSERYKEKKLKRRYLMSHDSVTGLPNSIVVKKTLLELEKNSFPHTIFLIKPLALKSTRASFGMRLANEYLTNMIMQLREHLASENLVSLELDHQHKPVFLARFNDDTLALIVKHSLSLDLVEQYICTINGTLEMGINLQGTHLVDRVEIGVANFPKHATSAEELQQKALQSLHIAANQPDNWYRYEESTSVIMQQKLKLAADLRRAIRNNEFLLYHQPQIDLRNNSIYGSEVLLRWQHPELGFISPEEFIPVAESAGVINDITEWVVEEGLYQHQKILALLPSHKVSINISARDLTTRSLPVQLLTLMTDLELSAASIVIELTESATVSAPLSNNDVLDDFKKMGLKLAIDDYGTGYSSLAYLSQLRFNEIKIDKQFVMDLDKSKRDQTICKTTIEMAKSLDAIVVAEGVETEATANILRQYGCEVAQGYFYAKPMPLEDFCNWLTRFSKAG